ncbi:winged helix-turn-helix transcriptional regulator [Candidatus Saccharibacteria bacterium]|nr:winged helix-turn-helix transcriptional regulator [Candidatus Saccharibacteria bacterium]
MVQYNAQSLDLIFHSLADVTRRDILRRVIQSELNISDLAKDYDISFSAVAKHLRVLEKAKLIIKKRRGKEKVIVANPETINEAARQLEQYKRFINQRFDALDELLGGANE